MAGCLLVVIGVAAITFYMWLTWPDDDGPVCDPQCRAEMARCDAVSLALIEANDFDRERYLVSEGEHERRERAIRLNHVACWDRAEAASARRAGGG